MLVDRQTAEQNVELRAQAHRGPHPTNVRPYGVTVYDGVARSARYEAGQHGHGGGLSRPVVTQQHEYLVLVHVEVELTHRLLRIPVRQFERLRIFLCKITKCFRLLNAEMGSFC